ncbi:response regulator [Citreicella sp. C3M06]|uniref:response regulator n=1 Tax=Citreicella sp. C3M06 TaxID=2841564 RepID=UPI001C094A9E|nr:response regulator [Citreicella sp. C3M06]MBU2961697.1 response regulator [Citreicella sp. C3M06]
MSDPVKLLVVEDDPVLRDIMGDACAALGYPAALAATPVDAIGVLAQHDSIRLALVDVVLPGGISGFALAQQLRDARPELEVLLLSGYGKTLTLPPGFTGRVLAKPLPLEQLRAVLSEHLGAA